MASLGSFSFEVHGKVQGVFFRRYTEQKALSLGLVGWCRNTSRGTVEGVVEGDVEKLQEMKKWLTYEGSPYSRIDKFSVREESVRLSSLTFDDFTIRP
eukprot:TRINITY_DN1106_c0_g1_i1.p1 TRINITY_DN1106_c0_g1~~TRINITY_DN1106_c0_g1_i1.p1  ORF type:complete len:108 (+),score=26.24 TRINITY_DN1106_c0_g1_i1:31-324(+)